MDAWEKCKSTDFASNYLINFSHFNFLSHFDFIILLLVMLKSGHLLPKWVICKGLEEPWIVKVAEGTCDQFTSAWEKCVH